MIFGASAVSAALSSTTAGCSAGTNEVGFALLTSFNANAFFTPPAPTDAVGVNQCLAGPGGNATRTVTFSRPVNGPVFNITNIDASTLTFSAGPGGGAIQLTTVSKNAGLNLIGGTTLSSTVPMGTAPCSDMPPNPNNNPGCGSFRITEDGGPVTSFTMTNTTKQGSASDGWFWSLSFPFVTDLGIQKTVSPTTANPNDPVTYTLQVTNNGPDGTPSAVVTDNLPAGLTYVSNDAGCDASAAPLITCALGPLTSGASQTINITATVDSSAGGTIPNTATVTGPGDDSDPNNDADTADLLVPQPPGPSPAVAQARSARLTGPAGCIDAKSVRYTVRGSGIRQVRWFLNGKRIATQRRSGALASQRFRRVIGTKKLKRGKNKLRAVVRFDSSAGGGKRRLNRAVQRCRSSDPAFTG